MGYIIKPLVTEKMTALTEKSSEDKQMTSGSKRTVDTHGATEETKSYTVKRKNGDTVKKSKTVYKYTKQARPQYGFIVKPEANKIEIQKEVEQKFNVNVVSVNTIRYNGKSKRRYTRSGVIKGRTNAFKKAIVTLREGETIDFYSNI
jgi:large subunit ribosomal protein L23